MQRITNDDLIAVMNQYRSAIEPLDLWSSEDQEFAVTAIYGQVLYFVRRPRGTSTWLHDLPGFEGSTGSGFLTKREAFESIGLAASTIRSIIRHLGNSGM